MVQLLLQLLYNQMKSKKCSSLLVERLCSSLIIFGFAPRSPKDDMELDHLQDDMQVEHRLDNTHLNYVQTDMELADLYDDMLLKSGFCAGRNNNWKSIFGEYLLRRTFEAKDYAEISMFSLLPEAIIDRCCDESPKAQITIVFTDYVIPVHRLFGRN